VVPVVALCLHRHSVAELTVSMAELFAAVEGIGGRTIAGNSFGTLQCRNRRDYKTSTNPLAEANAIGRRARKQHRIG
jgi:hypothetical protein